VRPEDYEPSRRAPRAEGLNDDGPGAADGAEMTSRGAKYWNSGAIPLIAPEILGDIIAEVADFAIVLSDEGQILSNLINPSNPEAARFDSWEGLDVRDTLTTESVPKFDERFGAFCKGKTGLRPVELNHTDSAGQWEFPIRYTFHRIGPDGAVLMLGRDLSPIAEMQQQLVKAQIALERDYEAQREFDTRFRVLMEATRDAVVFLSAQTGRVTDANSAAAKVLGRSRELLAGSDFRDLVEDRQSGELLDRLSSEAIAEQTSAVEVTLRKGAEKMRLVPTLFRAAGERILLCRILGDGQDSDPVGDLSRNLLDLFRSGPDAIVFCAPDGGILAANEGFLDLIDAAHDLNVKGRGLSDYLQRGSVDMRVMTENAARTGRMRIYPTKISGEYGTPRAVEIAVTALDAGASTVFAFIIRDASRAENVRPATAPVSDDNMQSVMELVGSATLKEIVSETTNVVEKMCIETAVELTMNNRVAAAEMLGLSRQSLYVKLRKYDLLSKDID